jgi:membrane-associated phospholipid phosphatase
LNRAVGHPVISVILVAFYHNGWSLLALGTLGIVVVSPLSELRRRYLTASVMLFFGAGTLAALALSSAGPPYYEHVVKGPDPYASLFSYLTSVGQATPLLSAGGQNLLWTAYRHRVNAFGLGISAMPSMHLATMTLVVCIAFAVGPWLGVFATACTIVMAIASVSLGWHYPLDGYVGALFAILVWWIAGRLERGISEATPAPVPDIPRTTGIPPSRRRQAAGLPEGFVAVGSANETTGWAGNFARRRTTGAS